MTLSNNIRKQKVALIFATFFIALVAFMSISTNVSAAESSNAAKEGVSVIASYPNEVYITENRSFSKNYAIPPATIYVTRTINGFLYGGTINRFSYVDADVRWLATYKGYVRAL